MAWAWRAVSVVYLIGGCFFVIAIWGGVISGDREPKIFDMAVPLVLTVTGAFWVAHSFRTSVALRDDAIELCNLFTKKRLPFDAIRGRREYVSRGARSATRYLKLEPNDDRLPTLEFEKHYAFDDVLRVVQQAA
jgi:hypothetical protein